MVIAFSPVFHVCTMFGYTSSILLSLCFVVLFHGCFAQTEQVVPPVWLQGQQPAGQRQGPSSPCQIQKLQALVPSRRIQSEAGVTEFFDQSAPQLQCAGVLVVRSVIDPQGLLLPSFTTAPQLIFVTQGMGIKGTVFPGCPETYESWESQSQFGGGSSQSRGDEHQKAEQFHEGDMLAVPTGTVQWIYNNGQAPLVLVSLIYTGNVANQLDQNFRMFFIAGNPTQEGAGNILSGFDPEILSQSFNINAQLAARLQGQQDSRGTIVRALKGFQVISQQSQQGQGQGQGANGLEETSCTMKLIFRIAGPELSDVFNPFGGHLTNVDSFDFPILGLMGLSATRGVLYKHALLAPQWSLNAHTIVYVTRGNARIQIVGDNGQNIFDGQVQQDHLIVVPQNFAVVKKAGDRGIDWISFRTHSTAMTTTLAGRNSATRAMPLQVLMNAFGISMEQAQMVKQGRTEIGVFSPLPVESQQRTQNEA